MDSSQLTRLRHEAANVYLARNKTVDASLLTMQNMQKASFAGTARFNSQLYYKGTPIVNPIVYDSGSCPQHHSFSQGYTPLDKLSQQESIANERGGAALCGDADYSTAPSGIQLKNCSTISTIMTSYNNNTPQVSIVPFVAPVIRFPKLSNIDSLYFNGFSFLELSADPRDYSNTKDFTIEFFIRPGSSFHPSQYIFYIYEDFSTYPPSDSPGDSAADTYRFIGTLVQPISNEPDGPYTFNVQLSTFEPFSFGEFNKDTWYHVAIERYGTLINYFQNGNYMGTKVIGENIPSTNTVNSPPVYNKYMNSSAILGAPYGGPDPTVAGANCFTGHISNFRWTKGVTLYSKHMFSNYMNPNDYRDTTLFNQYVFSVPLPPFTDNSSISMWSYELPYVSVLLLASSYATVIKNSCSPPAYHVNSVSITDGNTIDTTNYDLVVKVTI
jgi:hypothetical protein